MALGLNVPVQPTGKATRGAVVARVGEGRWLYPPALFAGAEVAAVPAGLGKVAETRSVCRWDALDHDGTSEAAPEDSAGKDHTDEDAGSADDDGTGTEALPPDNPDDKDAPEADEPPAVPIRRRRSRKHGDEARAAA